MASRLIIPPVKSVVIAPVRLPPLPSIGDILKLYGLRAQKHLSQHFLLDPRLCASIVKAAGKIEDGFVCEIGPGPGNISRPILDRGARHLTVLETDRRFLPALQQLQDACNGRMDIMIGNALRHDLGTFFPKGATRYWHDHSPNIHLVANLPFNISLPLLIRWLENISEKSGMFAFGRCGMTLSFQAEVAARMAAPPGVRERGRISLMVQNYCHVKVKKVISGDAFVPKAKVATAVVKFTPLRDPLINLPFKLIERVTKHVFMHRQKHCKHCVKTLFPDSKKQYVSEMFQIAEVNPEMPSFRLTNEEIGRLCYAYFILCQRIAGLCDYDFTKKLQFRGAEEEEEKLENVDRPPLKSE